MPGMESIVPGTEYVIPGTDRPVESSEPLPIPSVRQSPSSARPMNDRYGAIEAAEAEGVTPAVYYPTTMQTIEQ
jgi:hypothetical protein